MRRFAIHEAVSTLFTVSVWARSDSPTIDLQAIIGQPAGLRMVEGATHGARLWGGICSYIEQTHAERRVNNQQSTYYLRIVPMMWVLQHGSNHRIFQHLAIPDIVHKILDEWSLPRVWRIDRGQYPKLEYKVQYGESNFAFVCRLLEEAGIAYTFPDEGGATPVLTLSDALQSNPLRERGPARYEDNPTVAVDRDHVSLVRLVHDVRPGAYTLRDYDMRKPAFPLFGEAPKAAAPELRYDQYHSLPGGFLVESAGGGDTPAADDKGVYRHDQGAGNKRATRALEAIRADREGVEIEGNLGDLYPGVVFLIADHPHPDLARKLLVTDVVIEGSPEGEWRQGAHCVFADVPFRPPFITPRPEALGVQTVKIVGPKTGLDRDQEIHTDEFGRVRVQFYWDRHGTSDDDSSCWMRVSQGWGGAGYGWLNLPRVGHEVLVTFLEGDPDRPVVAGRVYNTTHPVPYKLPDNKTVSTWKSDSSPGSNGFNEFRFDDKKGDELFLHQAEKNRRLLVKHDETLTVGTNRNQSVIADETETVGLNRTQVTLNQRHTMIGIDHTTLIAGTRRQLVIADETEFNYSRRLLLVAQNVDAVVKGKQRERDEWDLHRHALADRKEQVGLDHSQLVYQEKHEKVGESFAREAGQELHVVAGHDAVGEAPDVTVKGPGGFIRIDAMGVTISGTMVDINVSGSPGHGHGSHPKEVELAIEAKPKTGVLWDAGEFKDHAVVAALREALNVDVDHAGPDAIRSLELVRMVLDSDVTTPHDGLILWSGGDKLAGAAADQLAEQRTNDPTHPKPSLRLEGTPGGKALLAATKAGNDDFVVAKPAWTAISVKLAAHASGDVNVVVSKVPLGDQAIFRQEAKALAANPKVTSIKAWAIVHDADGKPVTGPDGKFALRPVDLKDVLAKPKKP